MSDALLEVREPLTFAGTIGDGAVPGLIWAFRIHDDGTAEPLQLDQPIADRRDGWVWLHLNLVDTRCSHWLQTLDLPEAAKKLLVAHDNHQQLHAAGDSIYGVFSDLSRSLVVGGDDRFAHLHFAMTERLLVSGRYHELEAVDKVGAILRQGDLRMPSVAALLELIVEHVADAVDRLADKMSDTLDKAEDLVAEGGKPTDSQELAAARRNSVKVHRQLAGLRTLFHRLEREGTETLRPALQLAAGKLAQRLDALDHDIVEIRDRARLLQEEIGDARAEASNRALNILAVITTIFLPPTLVTGVFGMNVKGLPFAEDGDGFLWVCGVMALSALAVYFLMRRIGAAKF